MDCFTFMFGGMVQYKLLTGLAETTATLAPLPDKGRLPRHFLRVLLFSFFDPSLYHPLPLLEESYNLSLYRNCLKKVEETMRKKTFISITVWIYKRSLLRYGACSDTVITFLDLCFEDTNRSFLWGLLLWLHLLLQLEDTNTQRSDDPIFLP